MKLVSRPRAYGKTQAVLKWMSEAPASEVRVFVAFSHARAMQVYRSTMDPETGESPFYSWQFVSHEEVQEPRVWSAIRRKRLVLGLDDADIILRNLFKFEVGLATFTDPDE